MSTPRAAAASPRHSPAKKRLLDAATDLFYSEGIHSVGVDRIIEAAGVTRATMYKQFDGKEGLVLAYLRGEDERLRMLFTAASAATSDPDALLELVIAGIEQDIRERHTRGCPFINAAAEYPDEWVALWIDGTTPETEGLEHGGMPKFGEQFTPEQIASIVAYLQTLP